MMNVVVMGAFKLKVSPVLSLVAFVAVKGASLVFMQLVVFIMLVTGLRYVAVPVSLLQHAVQCRAGFQILKVNETKMCAYTSHAINCLPFLEVEIFN